MLPCRVGIFWIKSLDLTSIESALGQKVDRSWACWPRIGRSWKTRKIAEKRFKNYIAGELMYKHTLNIHPPPPPPSTHVSHLPPHTHTQQHQPPGSYPSPPSYPPPTRNNPFCVSFPPHVRPFSHSPQVRPHKKSKTKLCEVNAKLNSKYERSTLNSTKVYKIGVECVEFM